MRNCLVWLALFVALGAQGAEPYVPKDLEAWRNWVLQGHEEVNCPYTKPLGFTCRWPGVLALDVTQEGTHFAQHWHIMAPTWVALPGDKRNWPEQVKVNGVPTPIAEHGGTPTLFLGPGKYRITGRIAWEQVPERLKVPATAGIVHLTRQGERVLRPRWGNGALWLRENHGPVREADHLELAVQRLLADGIPQTLVTRVHLTVSGSARTVRLGPALLGGFELLSVESRLPVRIDPQGILYAQVRPGEWDVLVRSHARHLFTQAGPPVGKAPWPAVEIWSYRPNETLRVTTVKGDSPVDPRKTLMPAQWYSYPAYHLAAGDTLHIIEHSRGADLKRDNQLKLQRRMWLRFDGEGWVIEDRITGRMVQGWRLSMTNPYRLKRLEEHGEPRLLTRLGENKPIGTEVRSAIVDVYAISKLDADRGVVPVSGWTQELQSLDVLVQLPPGYRLFAVSGYDKSRGDWLSRWDLMSIFLVVIVAVAAARLYGFALGCLALFALIFTAHVPGAPWWLWLNALVALALPGLLPAGWLHRTLKVYAGIALLALLVVYVPFALQQARLALYPQLANQNTMQVFGRGAGRSEIRPQAAFERRALRQKAVSPGPKADRAYALGSSIKGPGEYLAPYAPGALIQAGIAAPDWQWQGIRLSLSGPVRPAQTASYWVMPPWLTGLWRITGVLLSGLLLSLLISCYLHQVRCKPHRRRATATALLIALVALPGVTLGQTPNPHILQELENRLTRPPVCAPNCVQIQGAIIRTDGEVLEIRLDVHALGRSAVALPGTRDGWIPSSMRFEGKEQPWLLQRNQTLWAPLPGAGRFHLTLRGRLPNVNAFNLHFPMRPKKVTFSGDGWTVSGLREGRMVSQDLRFVRSPTGPQSVETADSVNAPPFVILHRTFQFGTRWTISTQVQRRAPMGTAFSVTVPLLPGERVITQDARIVINNGRATLTFPAGTASIAFKSHIPMHSPLTLTAAEGKPFRERWSFRISHIWHTEFEGLPPAATVGQDSSAFSPLYYPYPGEQLTLTVTRPEAVPGDTLSFDAVTLNTRVGLRWREATLKLRYRATRGGNHKITLPPGATLQQVSLDGQSVGIEAIDGEIPISILPGVHRVQVQWEQATEDLSQITTAQPQLNTTAANLLIELNLPADRWVLWASGPRLGPVVMYWSELAFVLVIAMILGSFKGLPLSRKQWVLLAFGLSLTAWPVLLILFAWLDVLDWRARRAKNWQWRRFDLTQLALFGFSLLALGALLSAIATGLLSTPDMGIFGYGSTPTSLRWFADYSDGLLPSASVITLPLWCYKALILAWSVWLSLALMGWLKWAWARLSKDGVWRNKPRVQRGKS